MRSALGLIESIGLTTAITALDAASKAADVRLAGFDKVIGVSKKVSVTIQIAGEVAAVRAAVDAGVAAAERVGEVVASHVIPRPHEEVDKLLKEFEKNLELKREKRDNESSKENKENKVKKIEDKKDSQEVEKQEDDKQEKSSQKQVNKK